jgi:hypothetical protein
VTGSTPSRTCGFDLSAVPPSDAPCRSRTPSDPALSWEARWEAARGVHTSTAGRGAVMWPGCGPHSTPRGVLAAGVEPAGVPTRLPSRPVLIGAPSTRAWAPLHAATDPRRAAICWATAASGTGESPDLSRRGGRVAAPASASRW